MEYLSVIGIGAAALVTASTPVLIAGAIGLAGFGLTVLAGVGIDYVADKIKDKYYGR